MSKTVYLNISQITEVRHKEIQLKDVADVYCDDTAIMNKCKALRIKTIHLDRNKRYIEKTLDVIKKLMEMDSTLQINNVGEVDFITHVGLAVDQNHFCLYRMFLRCILCHYDL